MDIDTPIYFNCFPMKTFSCFYKAILILSFNNKINNGPVMHTNYVYNHEYEFLLISF